MKKSATLLFLLSIVCSCNQNTDNSKDPLVLTCEVEIADGSSYATFPARVESSQNSNMAFMVSGTIQQVFVDKGDKVRSGDPLVMIDDRDYNIQLSATKAEYNQIKAEVDRVIALYEENAVSANDYDKARYGLEQITQKLRHHEDQVADCIIRAPYDAYVDEIHFKAGETVMAGMPVVSLSGKGQTVLTTALSADVALRSDEFESFTAEFQSMPGKALPVNLKSLSHGANSLQLYDATFSLPSDEYRITPGMTAAIRIKFRANGENSFLIPVSSMFRYGNESCVYVFDEETSSINRTSVEILSINNSGKASIRGLDAGSIVITAGVSKLSDGQKVRRMSESSSSNPGGLL